MVAYLKLLLLRIGRWRRGNLRLNLRNTSILSLDNFWGILIVFNF